MFSKRIFLTASAILLSTQLFVGCSAAKEALTGTELASTETQQSFTDSASDLIDSGTLGGNANSQSTSLPTGTVSTAQQAQCQATTGFSPGFSGVGSFNTNSFNDFGTSANNTNSNTSTLNNSGGTCQLFQGQNAQTAANIGLNTYDFSATCMQVAEITLYRMKGNSTGPNLSARMAAGEAFLSCLQVLVQRQNGAANWTAQAQMAFGNSYNNVGMFRNYLGNFR